MLKQIKNECFVQIPLFDNNMSLLPVGSSCRKAFQSYFLNNNGNYIKVFSSKVSSNVFFDVKSLKQLIIPDCLHCYKNCCKGKHRVPTSTEFSTLYEEHYQKILQSVPECYRDEFQTFVANNGMFMPHVFIKKFLDVKTIDNHCCFSFIDENGLNKCVIHKYCLDNNIDYNLFKPGSCSLFPIDIVKFKTFESNGYFVFLACKDTYLFSRFSVWEENKKHNVLCPCLDLQRGEELGFDKSCCIPAYEYAESFISTVFDVNIVDIIENVDKSKMYDINSKRLFNPHC